MLLSSVYRASAIVLIRIYEWLRIRWWMELTRYSERDEKRLGVLSFPVCAEWSRARFFVCCSWTWDPHVPTLESSSTLSPRSQPKNNTNHILEYHKGHHILEGSLPNCKKVLICVLLCTYHYQTALSKSQQSHASMLAPSLTVSLPFRALWRSSLSSYYWGDPQAQACAQNPRTRQS
jgi:hypothetical protein